MATIKIQTVFNIDLEFETAQLPRRVVSYFIDLIILLAYFLLAKFAFYGNRDILYGSGRGLVGLDTIAISTPMLLYALVCEISLHGQSIGKKLMGIRVISLDGKEPTVNQYMVRWIFRVFEWPFFFGYVAFSSLNIIASLFVTLFLGLGVFIPIAITSKGQRLGDLAANTTVVRTKTDFSVNDTLFIEITDQHYQVSFPSVLKLSDRDINTITRILGSYGNKSNADICNRLALKVKTVLHIDTDLDSVPFLKKLIKDYNYLTSK